MKFADYVLENYIDVDSNYPPMLWARPQDECEAIRHTISGVGMSHLNAEFYVKHPYIYNSLIEHGFMSAPTQYRLYGRRFLQV